MAKHTWTHNEDITTERMNDIEDRIEAKAAKGDPGDAGKGVTDVSLETTDGKVTGGTWKDTTGTSHSITVAEKPKA